MYNFQWPMPIPLATKTGGLSGSRTSEQVIFDAGFALSFGYEVGDALEFASLSSHSLFHSVWDPTHISILVSPFFSLFWFSSFDIAK